MFDFLSFRRKKNRWDLPEIETVLQSSLKPVAPRPEFIQSLHRGLMDFTFPEPEHSDWEVKKAAVFALVGFVSLIFVFSLWIRLVMVVITTLGMLQASGRRNSRRQQINQ